MLHSGGSHAQFCSAWYWTRQLCKLHVTILLSFLFFLYCTITVFVASTAITGTSSILSKICCNWGHTVAQLVEALCYKPEGRGFESDQVYFLNLPNLSSRTIALGSTQPPTEMTTRNFPWGVEGVRRVGLTSLPPSASRISRQNMWEPRRLTTLCAFTTCYRDNFTFFTFYLLQFRNSILGFRHYWRFSL
jgi:hypothetical protein